MCIHLSLHGTVMIYGDQRNVFIVRTPKQEYSMGESYSNESKKRVVERYGTCSSIFSGGI